MTSLESDFTYIRDWPIMNRRIPYRLVRMRSIVDQDLSRVLCHRIAASDSHPTSTSRIPELDS
jgi:hypothetical protein